MEENTATPRLSIGYLLIFILAAGAACFVTAGVAAIVPLSMTLVSQSNADPCSVATTTLTCSVSGLTIGGKYLFVVSAFTFPFSSTSFTCSDAQGFATNVIGGGNQKTQCSVLITSATASTDTLTLVATANWQHDADQLFKVTSA